ncbi:hypothetical protein GR156_20555, partial [Shinella zoogloeoides]
MQTIPACISPGWGGADHLEGGAGEDVLQGGSGDDVIDGKGGNDWVDYGREYDTTMSEDAGAARTGIVVDLQAGTATDTYGDTDQLSNIENVYGTSANDIIRGDAADNILVSGGGEDTLTGRGGNDTFGYTTGAVTVTDFTAGGDIAHLGNAPTAVTDLQVLLGYVDEGNTTDAVFDFGNGNVLTLKGVDWNTLTADDFVFNEGPAIDTPTTFVTAEGVTSGVADIDATDPDGDTVRYSISGADAGLFRIDEETGVIDFITAPDFEKPSDADGDNSYEIVVSASDDIGDATTQNVTIIVSNVTGITYNGTAAANTISGTTTPAATGEEDILNGNGGNDILSGLGGNDTLDGGAGIDTLIGGTGDDIYIVDNASDVVTEAANQGTDTIRTGLATYSLAGAAGRLHVENLSFTSTAAHTGTGNDRDNVITGNIGNDVLNGGVGNDTLIGDAGNDTLIGGIGNDVLVGGQGNDIYVVDAGDTIVEAADEGIDTVQSAATFSLELIANVENLTLTGSAAHATGNALDNVLVGNGAANTLTGLGGNDTLNGGAGADTLVGGTGDDIYIVDNTGDVVTELTDEGNDTIQTSLAVYSLNVAGRENVENLTLTAAAATMSGTGNALNNILTALGNGN